MTQSTYDVLYKCTRCQSVHSNEEWLYATSNVYGEKIKPIVLADSPDFEYICPSCNISSNITSISTIR